MPSPPTTIRGAPSTPTGAAPRPATTPATSNAWPRCAASAARVSKAPITAARRARSGASATTDAARSIVKETTPMRKLMLGVLTGARHGGRHVGEPRPVLSLVPGHFRQERFVDLLLHEPGAMHDVGRRQCRVLRPESRLSGAARAAAAVRPVERRRIGSRAAGAPLG